MRPKGSIDIILTEINDESKIFGSYDDKVWKHMAVVGKEKIEE